MLLGIFPLVSSLYPSEWDLIYWQHCVKIQRQVPSARVVKIQVSGQEKRIVKLHRPVFAEELVDLFINYSSLSISTPWLSFQTFKIRERLSD